MFLINRKIVGMCMVVLIWGCVAIAFAGPQDPSASLPEAVLENQRGMQFYDRGFYDHIPHGRNAEAAQEFVRAEKAFKKAIEMDNSYTDAHRNLAHLYFVQKKYNDAAKEYAQVIELSPEDLDVYVSMARAQIKLGNFNKAIEYLELVKTKTDNKQALQKLDEYIEKIKQAEQPN